jgi:glucans biosynthesis protein
VRPARGRSLVTRCPQRVLLAALLVAGLPDATTEASAFSLDDVAARASKLAASPYRKPSVSLPKVVKSLGYDEYRDIRFKPARALWRDAKLPFEIMFFHQGWLYEHPVAIHEVSASSIRQIRFDPQMFDYGKHKIDPKEASSLAFAGFRVHFPLNTPRYRDEALSFLGASYFRALGKGQRYGLSARGLAVDTAAATGEEFPHFVEYWIVRPPASARELTIYALLDSPRVAGAYRFVLKPGVTTALDIEARLFLRASVDKLGLAPLTSMFFFGANQRSAREDHRPEVHDSDGLSIRGAGDEWIWRPLVNPKRLLVTSFVLTNPLGFGLVQRERWFGRYEDLEARYDLRPSAWVEPKGEWGAGRLELVQIPAPHETNDNIVAYWVPDRQPAPGAAYAYAYRVLWQKDRETRPSLARVQATRRGRGYIRLPADNSIEMHVDFQGEVLARMPAGAEVTAAVSVDANGEILGQHTTRNEVTGGWRLSVRFKRLDTAKPLELRAHLREGEETLSETWSYILPPE